MKNLAVLSLMAICGAGWAFGVFVFVFGFSLSLSMWLRGFYHAFLLGFPFAAVAVLYFYFSGASNRVVLIPIWSLIALGITLSISNVLKENQQAQDLSLQDKTMVRRSLEDLLVISTPSSFKWDSAIRIENFYYLDPPISDQFTYYFDRATYPTPSGYVTPVKLSVTIYASGTFPVPVIQLETGDLHQHGLFDYQNSTIKKIERQFGTIENLETLFPKEGRAAICIFTDMKIPLRVALSYDKKFLDENQVVAFLDKIIPSIAIKADLLTRLKQIETEFYKAHPDKK